MLDRNRLHVLLERERQTYETRLPRSRAAYDNAGSLLGRVPMTWMNKSAGRFPAYLDEARGARVRDIDGFEYVDFCLGDTGAMAGHSPEPVMRAVRNRLGLTAMLPSEDAERVGAELTRRFKVGLWSFSLTATDANRWAIRLARQITGRPKILVFNFCYHGSVDETVVTLGPGGVTLPRPGNVGPPVDPALTTRVVEFNDLDALDRALSHGDVACVLMEPALTNIGIVLPEPGFLPAVRELTRRHGTLLINDETHTFSAGPGGCTRAWDLDPDIVTIGKSIAGGVPIGAYGVTREVADRILAEKDADLVDVGGVGGTLAGNALSIAAARATLEEVLTEDAFAYMTTLAARFTDGVAKAIEGLPWSVTQLGARTEYRFGAPKNGGESAALSDDELDDYFHLFMHNRGVLMTPFHNMALMCPSTTAEDVDLHTELFTAAVTELTG
ncbi:aspartate aminotransferase family protein [Planotetraspora phitsanulokensis]|uniref:Aminotransferase n=1 Tax=Planotetraspora phitsanulokensis TaxID=575192 RepID=A0A8J3XBK9_9ACTN|nr:transaminase [Planotetraspora phitsanulokensis]GII35135.1 aminotransferase [Planotetraspora phitsanulokensis]